jgi:antitoxin FitA
MTRITIALPEEQALKLQELAQAAGTSPEELLRAGVEEWLSRPSRDFAEAANYVLQKNAELYRRLA